ncbi:hypothetical protein ACYCCF_00600 [Streptomyces argenteolus]|uniref:hypothetical protein n=1 Tax=Streptomyces sp. NPDC025273 TaxID=3155251 RepID=UPI00338CA793
MSTLTVWEFHPADGAENVGAAVKSLRRECLLGILDPEREAGLRDLFCDHTR